MIQIGVISTILAAMLEEEVESRFDVHLAQISQLPPCEGGTSTASFEWMICRCSRRHGSRCRLSSMELDAIGDFVSCPGDPVEDTTLDLIGGRPIDI